jgi:site-specific DNA-methyltransferase (adenine-specific)
MSELADGNVGLIVTSPPYGVGMEYEDDISFENHLENMISVLSECARVLVPGGKICINVGDIHNFGTRNGGKPEIELVGHHIQKILRRHNVRMIDKIIWKKCTPGKRDFNWSSNPQVNYHDETKHSSYRILNNTEHIYIFQKEGEREVPFDIEHESKISKDEWKEWVDGVWEIRPVKGKKGHPAPFPEELVKRLIIMYSYKGDRVCDPMAGSCTVIKVANELGRIGIGYEKEQKYKQVIMKKLGIKEENLKKSDCTEVQKEKDDNKLNFIGQFEEEISKILAENYKTKTDIVSVQIPFNSLISKDDIIIDWASDFKGPDPPESGDPPKLNEGRRLR